MPRRGSLLERRFSVRAHLIVLVLAAVLPMVVFTAWLAMSLSGERRITVERETADSARAVANNIDRELSAVVGTLNILSMSRNLQAGDLARFRDDAERRVTTQSQWIAVVLSDPSGRELMNTRRPFATDAEPVIEGDRESLTRAMTTGLPAVGALQPGPSAADAYFAVRVPVYQDVRLVYVLSAMISAGNIRDILIEQKLSGDRFGVVVDSHGRILAHSEAHAEFVGKSSPYPVSTPASPLHVWTGGVDSRGRVYYTQARSNVSGWTAVAVVPALVVDQPFWRSVRAVTTGGLGFLLLGILAATFLGHRITGPIRVLAGSAYDLCSGRLTRRPRSPVAEVDAMSDALLHAGLQRADADRNLRDREERLSAMVNQATAGIVQSDLRGRLTFVNDRFCELVQRPRDEVLHRRIEDIVHSDDLRAFRDILKDLQATGRSRTFDTRFVQPGGRVVWANVSISRIRELGQPGSALAVVTEITDRKAVEAERAALLARERLARAEAEKANLAKDQFLATLSHELRTPLNALRLWAGVLRQQPLDAATLAKAVDTIDRNAALQAQLIDDLLDISRIASGKLRLEMRPLDLRSVIESAVETVRAAAEDKGLTIARALDPDAGLIMGDATRLQQVLWNLLTNAVKFTPRGGRVEVLLGRRVGHAELCVRDTGQGIAPDLLPRIFDRFRQGDSSTTRVQGGLGLGLAIARQLVELHGGGIKAESPGEGQGATMTVILPLAHRSDGQPAGPSARHEPSELTSILAGVRVLFVDDDGDAREACAMSLGWAGAKVATAASVPEAMHALEHEWPDVLVSDIGMPGEDGLSLIGRVRRVELARGVGVPLPAVALTAYASDEDAVRILAAGYHVHVKKPIEPFALVDILADVLDRRAGVPPLPGSAAPRAREHENDPAN
ncbi:MAG TPA: ATP-binding protein [Methylomirabilota bacterium]|nr:ATP-binding protein [Methylomirabilota bacterium]